MNLFNRRSLDRHTDAAPAATAVAAFDPALTELTGEWAIDPAHSRIGFSVRHAMVTTVRGAFTEYDSRLYLDGYRPERSQAHIVINVGSVDTGVQQRDAHLVSPDFFDAARHPRMSFRSTGVEVVSRDLYRMSGGLTIKGVTRPVVLDLTYIGHVIDPFGFDRIGFDGTTTINRSDWGLTYDARLATGGALVSEKVRLQFDIAVIRAVPAA